jgi:hypothetical protein
MTKLTKWSEADTTTKVVRVAIAVLAVTIVLNLMSLVIR